MNMRFMTVASVIVAISLLAFGCNDIYRVEKDYSKYRHETDLVKYREGLYWLTEMMLNSESIWDRGKSAEELGKCSLNETKGARQLLLDIAVPVLIKGIEEEENPDIRATIIRSLDEIGPDEDTVINIYFKYADTVPGAVMLSSIKALKHIGWDMKDYVPIMVEWLDSENHFIRSDALQAIHAMGCYTQQAFDRLLEIAENDPFSPNRLFAQRAIESIAKDQKEDLDEATG